MKTMVFTVKLLSAVFLVTLIFSSASVVRADPAKDTSSFQMTGIACVNPWTFTDDYQRSEKEADANADKTCAPSRATRITDYSNNSGHDQGDCRPGMMPTTSSADYQCNLEDIIQSNSVAFSGNLPRPINPRF